MHIQDAAGEYTVPCVPAVFLQDCVLYSIARSPVVWAYPSCCCERTLEVLEYSVVTLSLPCPDYSAVESERLVSLSVKARSAHPVRLPL